MLTREQLLQLATIIREETAQGLNTAQRVGHLLYEIASSLLIRTQDDQTSHKLSADELEAVERLIVVGTQLVGQNNTALEEVVSRIHGSQVIEGNSIVDGVATNKGDTFFGPQFVSGLLGKGGFIGPDGAAELKSLKLREFLEAPEYRLNKVTSVAGQLVQSWCNGTIEQVVPLTASTGYFLLKLEDGEAGSGAAGDICMGIFHFGNGDATTDSDDLKGNITVTGFTTTYFRIDSARGVRNKIVYYTLRPHVDPDTHQVTGYYPHPKAFMKFAGYGNFTNAARQTSIIIAHSYIRMLRNVDNWEFDFANIAMQIGELDGLHEAYKNEGCPVMTGYSAYLRDIYFTGKIEQLDDDAIDSIRDKLKNYNIYISEHVDMITVDDVGNVIGGLWQEETDANDNVFRTYRIHSAITVRNGSKVLTIAAPNAAATEGKYQIYLQPHGCSCFLQDSTIYITAIENIKDGVAGTPDDANFDYDLMRDTESCSVDILIDCEGVGTITKQFPITIKHSSEPFIGADITNQFSAVSWNTKTLRYIGLPIVFDMKMWHNNEILDIASDANISLVSATAGVTLVNGSAPATPAASSIYYTKSVVTLNGKKHARITLTAMGADLPLVIDLDLTCTAIYSGISYERTLRHTINKSTDTNVYRLKPLPDEVGVVYNDNKQKVASTNKVYCSVLCDSTDDKHYTVAVGDYSKYGLFVTYQTFTLNASNAEVGGVETAYSNVQGVSVSNDMRRIRFKLYKLLDTTLGTIGQLLDTTNVVEVLDTEDVPVVLDGLDGDNSIEVVLDNDSDNVSCNEDGSVIESTLPVIHACLMDGEEAKGSSVLGSTRSSDKQSFGTFSGNSLTQGWTIECNNCTAEIANAWATNDGKPWITINVMTVTDDTASVNVKCLYTKHGQSAYYARLHTISKLYGIDKHEIILSPNSICYKANDDSYTPTSFKVEIYKTTQEEDRHLMTSLPSHSTPQNGDYRLQYSIDKGVTWNNITGYSSGAVLRESFDSGSGNKFSWDDADSIEIRLMQYVASNSGGEWILLDQECEDIVADGLDGKGIEHVFFLQESWNEDSDDPNALPKPTLYDDHTIDAFQNDNYCPYTDSQHSDRWTDEPSGVGINNRYEFYSRRKKVNGVWQPFETVKLWNNFASSGESPYLLDLTNEHSIVLCDKDGNYTGDLETSQILMFRGAADAWDLFNFTVSAVGVSVTKYNNKDWDSNHVIHPHTLTANSAVITVTAELKVNSNIRYVETYKIQKSLAGQDAVIYSLSPSVDVVHKLADGSFDGTSMAIAVKKTVGGSSSLLESATAISDEGLSIVYKRGAVVNTEVSVDNPASLNYSTAFSTFSYITLFLKKGNTVVDRERINIVSDGEQGENADHHSIRVVGTNLNGNTESSHLEIDGSTMFSSSNRGLTVAIINPVSMTIERWNYYDVYYDASSGNTNYTDGLLNYLRNYGTSEKVVCIFSYDAVHITGRMQAFLANLYGVGQDLVITAKRRSIAIICQKGLQPGQAIVTMSDEGDAIALGTISCGALISLGSDRIKTSPSILKGASFKLMSAWAKKNGSIVKDDFERTNAYAISAPSSSYKDGLEQIISGLNSGPLKPDTWYTLSFYAKGGQIRSHVYPGIIDTNEKAYVDGAELSPAGDGERDWTLESDLYKRHTYTFKTLPKLTFRGSYSPTTSYARQHMVSVYLRGGGSYSDSYTYSIGAVVLYESYYYYSKASNNYGNTPYKGSSYWIRLDEMTSSDIGKSWYYVSLINSNSGIDFTNTSYWQKISADDTTLSTSQQWFRFAARLLFRKFSGNGTTYITQPKLEEGVIATDWELSDEDKTGLTGCHERVYETFDASLTYYNQEGEQTDGLRYVDFMAVENSSMSSGYKVYQCVETHRPSTLGFTTFAQCLAAGYWTEVSINAASSFFKYLIAKNANIKILASAQFTIGDTDGSIVAGLANTTIPLWIGSGVPSAAPFRVTRSGKLYATGAEISGKITATEGTIGGWVIKNGRLESQNKMSGSPLAYLDGATGTMRLKGTIQLSTAYSGNISDCNLFYLPALEAGITRNLSMGYEKDDIGKVVRLFNSSEFEGGRYYIEANTFEIEENGDSTWTSETNYTAIVDPQEIIEMTCFERSGSVAGRKKGQWVITGRFGIDNFKLDGAKGRFARVLAMGIITGNGSTPSISGKMWNGKTLAQASFSITRNDEGNYSVSFPSGTLTSGYYVFFTGYGDNWKGSLINPTDTGFGVKVADDASLNDGNVSFIILDASWYFDT